MLQKIEQFILHHHLIKDGDVIVVGLSGGPDSVFLLHTLVELQKKYNLTLIAAHLNHEWRPEADQEQQDCQQLAHALNIPFVTIKRSELPSIFKQNSSSEESGRKMRRYFLEKVLHEHSAHHIALAHHAQDQEETFFIRLIRGASLTGLTAIKPKHGFYIRPLLETPKATILEWLHSHHIAYAHDKTNESVDYLRNCIRLTVLPALRACDKRFENNFIATLNRLKITENFLEHLAQETLTHISSTQNNQQTINIAHFFTTHEALHHRLLLAWLINEKVPFPPTQAFLNEIIRFMQNPQGGVHKIHTTWSLIKKQNQLYIQQVYKKSKS